MAKIDDELKSKFVDEHSRLWVNLIYTSSWMSAREADTFKPYNLSAQQFNILRILRGNGGWMKVHDIKDRMLDKSPNMTRLVDKLIDKDLVERHRCEEDRRVIYIRNTEAGSQILAKIDQDLDFQNSHPIYAKFSETEAKQLNELLDRVRDL